MNLAGKMLLPGFVEGHTHPMVGATLARGVDLQFDTRQEILDALKAYRHKIGSVDIVRGFGWRYNAFPAAGPRKEDLDAIWPDVPVILIGIDGHGAWVNSQALALAGVTKDTKDPIPGFSYFQRDPATGEPTGFLVEPPVMLQVNNAIEPFSLDYVAGGLAEWLPKAAAAGITTVFDAGIQVLPDQEGFALYSQLEREGKLPFRVIGSYYHNRPDVDPLPVIKALRREFQSELVRASVLKLNMDGGDNAHTGVFLAPYADAPETSGEPLLPPDRLPTSSGAPTVTASTSMSIASATGRPVSRSTRSRPRSRPTRRAIAGTPSPTSRWSIRKTSRASPSSASSRNFRRNGPFPINPGRSSRGRVSGPPGPTTCIE